MNYFLKRLALSVPLLLVISLLAFLLAHAAPGGPFDRERAPASPEIKRQIEAKYHLDQPMWRQYLVFLGNLARGDLGPSFRYRNHSVNDIIAQGLPVSMTLGGLGFCFALGVGIPIGFLSAARRGRWEGWAANAFAMVTVCVPGLVIAPILILLFAIHWRLLPVALWGSPLQAILPTVALGLFFSGRIARLTREGMLETMGLEFITTARAKGLSEGAVLFKHVFPMAALPVLSYCGPLLADLLTGSFVIENIFQIPGLGVFFVSSMLNSDYTMIIGLTLLYATILVALNLLVDLAYCLLDPRVKYD